MPPVPQRLLPPPCRNERSAERRIRPRMRRIDGQRVFVSRDGLIEPLRRDVRLTEVEPRQDEIRAELRSALEMGDGFVSAAARREEQSEVVVRLGMAGIEL